MNGNRHAETELKYELNAFDPNEIIEITEFNDTAFQLLKEKAKELDNLTISIPPNTSTQFTTFIYKKVARALYNIKAETRPMFWKSLGLILLGSIFYIVYWAANLQTYWSHIGGLNEFIMIFFWACIWKAADNLLFNLPDIKKQKKHLYKILYATVEEREK